MKRAPLVALGTVLGVSAILVANPDGPAAPTSMSPDTTGTTTGTTTDTSATNTSTTTSTTTDQATPAANSGTGSTSSAGNGTATGDAVFVRYGNVQLKVTMKNGTITDIKEIQMPDQDGRSMMITQQAGPLLREQALQANSANIAGVSGATFTTYGYQQSLQSALDKLK